MAEIEMNIFQQGDKAKFIITSQNLNLDMEACDFYVEIIYGMRSEKITIRKEDMLYGTDGEYVMILDTSECSSEGHDVRYELTDEPDIAAKYLRLVATENVIPEHGEPYTIYRPLITRNDEYIYALRESADALAAALLNANNNN